MSPDRRHYIFIYGHRYYPDRHGAYVRADGTMLHPASARPGQRNADAPADGKRPDAPAPGTDLLGDLDKLLDMLAPLTAEPK